MVKRYTMRVVLTLCGMSACLVVGAVETITSVRSGDWASPQVWNHTITPAEIHKVWVGGDSSVILRTSAAIDHFALGDQDKTGSLIIDGGSLTSRSIGGWNAVGYNNHAVLKIKNGGVLLTSSRLIIGVKDEVDNILSELVVEDGILQVDGVIELGKDFDGVADTGGKVSNEAILRVSKGRVEAHDLLISPEGNCRVNLIGGTLVLDGDHRETLAEYVSDGRMFADSKASGAQLNIDYHMGKTTITVVKAAGTLGLVF